MRKYIYIFLLVFTMLITVSCGDSGSNQGETRTTQTSVLVPSADGTSVHGTDKVSIDTSNSSAGYIMVRYEGSAAKIKLQITAPDGETVFTYTIKDSSWQTFPLSAGDGTYEITVLENTAGDFYAMLYSFSESVTLENEFLPFLYPNQYVWFTSESSAVSLAESLSEESYDDLDFVESVYDYVISNVEYDYEKAKSVSGGYVPDIDKTLKSGKGICFDYASLMTAMLRSQSIPAKLVTGYSGQSYHAWISVYLSEQGWVDNIIEFDGKTWSLMDPTLAASNDRKSVQKYIGDGTNYIVKYYY